MFITFFMYYVDCNAINLCNFLRVLSSGSVVSSGLKASLTMPPPPPPPGPPPAPGPPPPPTFNQASTQPPKFKKSEAVNRNALLGSIESFKASGLRKTKHLMVDKSAPAVGGKCCQVPCSTGNYIKNHRHYSEAGCDWTLDVCPRIIHTDFDIYVF